MAKIDYYNAILGMPFLRQHGIILDFTSPGSICMGTKMVPRHLPPIITTEKAKPTAQHSQPTTPSPGE